MNENEIRQIIREEIAKAEIRIFAGDEELELDGVIYFPEKLNQVAVCANNGSNRNSA